MKAPPAPEPVIPSLGREVTRLATSSLVYLLPTVLVRGINFLLVPVYTAMMTPADYGIVGLASTLTPLLTIALSGSIHSAASRLHFEFPEEREQRRLYATILLFLLVAPAVVVMLLLGAGSLGWLELFETISFRPHLRLILLTAYFGVFPSLLINIYVARETPARTALFNVVLVVVTIACALYFIVYLRQGAVGQLRGALLASVIGAVATVATVVRLAGLSFSRTYLKKALLFSLPLVPHLLSNWALRSADRVILERWVERAELGRYSLAVTIATVAAIVTNAIAMALLPVVNRRLRAGDPGGRVPRLGTYVLVPSVAASLAVAMLSGDLIRLAINPEYHGAIPVIPWVVLGFLFQAFYGVASLGTFYSKRTAMVPVMTGIGAAINVGLNLVAVPRFGIMAAAVNASVACAAMTALHALLAHRLFPIAWEYRRWGVLLVAGALTFSAGELLRFSPAWSLAAKSVLLLTGFPALLVLFGFVTDEERQHARALVARILRRKPG